MKTANARTDGTGRSVTDANSTFFGASNSLAELMTEKRSRGVFREDPLVRKFDAVLWQVESMTVPPSLSRLAGFLIARGAPPLCLVHVEIYQKYKRDQATGCRLPATGTSAVILCGNERVQEISGHIFADEL